MALDTHTRVQPLCVCAVYNTQEAVDLARCYHHLGHHHLSELCPLPVMGLPAGSSAPSA